MGSTAPTIAINTGVFLDRFQDFELLLGVRGMFPRSRCYTGVGAF